jgi:hypothetical protein
MNKLLAAAAVAGILVSGSVIAAEPSEWCEGYEAGTTYISPRWNSWAKNFVYVFMTEEQLDNGMQYRPDKI